jgi:hypothetical protein
MLLLRAFILLGILMSPIAGRGLEALGSLTSLNVTRGSYYYLGGTDNVVLKAWGYDCFGYTYEIRGWMEKGCLRAVFVSDWRVGL